jgi:hypothetical protein
MQNIPITNHAVMSDEQKHLAQRIWYYAIVIRSNAAGKTPDGEDDIIDDVEFALSGLWYHFYHIGPHIPDDQECMYMLPTITSGNFNSIALNALEQLQLLMREYRTSFSKISFAYNSRSISRDVDRIRVLQNIVIARCE